MPAIKNAVNEKDYDNAIVSSKVKSYANDPYFIKKNREAKQTLSKVGLPPDKKK